VTLRNFRQAWKSLVPRWASEGEGGLVGHVLMLLNDASMDRLYNGHLARFPQQGPDGAPGPDDALAALGRDRGVIRGIAETSRSYAYRLTQWLVDARTRGTAFTMMKVLHDYCDSARVHGMSFRIVDSRGNWYSRSSAGVETSSLDTGNWTWDGEEATRWARFWVIVYPGTLWAVESSTWGTGLWGDGGAWGSTIAPDEAATIRTLEDGWKPAGTRCHRGILAFDAASFDPTAPEPDGLWGNWSKVVGGVRVRARLSTARYMGGTL
jgi:hypothetical protein